MQAVSAVATTGIYCKPGCSAQPLARNVRPFPTAAAAEAAGYRACMRCRPYRYPPVLAASQPELVCRAVRLILDGLLDADNEATLANRLGLSPRHLRRLFMTHLGVTPDGLARSARVHFARRLIDETDLTITEIAFIAGFGSPRQFNRVCQAVFRASPSELRARRRRSDRLVADGGLALRLAYDGVLDWAALLACLAQTAIPGVEQVTGDSYRRTIVIANDPGVLELSPGGDNYLILRAHLPHWEELLHVAHRARRIAGLDIDYEEAIGHLGLDPIVGRLVRGRAGVHVPGAWDGFEIGIYALVRQAASQAAARRALVRLVEECGTPVDGLRQLGLTYAFPHPNVVANADLSGLGLSRSRVGAIRAFAAAVADGTVRVDGSDGLDRLLAAMTALPGVGEWAAHYVALRLGEPDALPLSDRQLARQLPQHSRGTSAERASIIERWRPWRALAFAHLWVATPPAATAQRGAA